MSVICDAESSKSRGKSEYPSLTSTTSSNESIELISPSVNLFKHQYSKKALLSSIQLDRKESLDQPYLEQQTRALLPNKDLYLAKTTLCREIERTRRLLESKHDVMKRVERLQSSSTIGKVLLRTGRKKEWELRGRLRTRLSAVFQEVQKI
jgi:hypothetical protein